MTDGMSAWAFACKWYKVESIKDALETSHIPQDVSSREFAEWMCNQYRLAMAKGIELGQAAVVQAVKGGA